jgi:hypothetical protein
MMEIRIEKIVVTGKNKTGENYGYEDGERREVMVPDVARSVYGIF